MNFSIELNQVEFIISSVAGPLIAGIYYTIKHILDKNKIPDVLRSEK